LTGDRGPRAVEYERLEGGAQSGVTSPSARLFSSVASLREEEWLSRLPEERRSALAEALEEGNTVVALFAGQRPTGGYTVVVDEVAGRGETLFIEYHVSEPGPGELVTQALTSPYVVLLVQGSYTRLETREE
ncbi:MAG: protease complex subunit PrcB family protein, partial [Spirochaetaceae bacterium]